MSANLIVGKDPTGNKVPVAVDAAGKLQIGGVQLDALNLNTDQIEGKQDVTNALLTTTAADLAAVKTQLATGTIAVTGGGGGGGGASAAYNATLPTYTSGASTVLQTDENGRLITTSQSAPLPSGAATSANQTTANTSLANLDAAVGNVADAVATSDTGSFSLIALTKRLLGKFSALTDGTQKSQIVQGANSLAVDSTGALTANNASAQVFNYTATGAVAGGTVLIGPIDCAQFREVSLQIVSVGTGMTYIAQISNDNTNWNTTQQIAQNANIAVTSASASVGHICFTTLGARYLRFVSIGAQTSGTTTLVAYASQQATPKLYQSVVVTSGSVSPSTGSAPQSFHTAVSAATANATSVASSAANIQTLVLSNTSASWRYFKIFNKNSSPVLGTDTPIFNIGIPPNSTVDVSNTFAGNRLVNGIAYAITSGSSLLDTGAVGAGDVLVNMSR